MGSSSAARRVALAWLQRAGFFSTRSGHARPLTDAVFSRVVPQRPDPNLSREKRARQKRLSEYWEYSISRSSVIYVRRFRPKCRRRRSNISSLLHSPRARLHRSGRMGFCNSWLHLTIVGARAVAACTGTMRTPKFLGRLSGLVRRRRHSISCIDWAIDIDLSISIRIHSDYLHSSNAF